jgi:hypothetical protein
MQVILGLRRVQPRAEYAFAIGVVADLGTREDRLWDAWVVTPHKDDAACWIWRGELQ